MLNGFKSPQTIALIGSTSEIGEAILKHLPLENLSTCYLAARNPQPSLQGVPSRTAFVPIKFEATDTQSHEDFVRQLFSHGDLDLAIIAIGVLGNDANLSAEANALLAMQVNYVAASYVMHLIAKKMVAQGHGRILVLSSFAQTRPRNDNFAYGSTKAGLDFMARGLNEKLRGTGVSVCVLRPGFVRTRMTQGMDEAPFSVNADDVGKIAASLIASKNSVGYAPSILKPLALIFSLLPPAVFRKISER